ncbi:MAG: HigA family addiction module antidote protein [Cyanobacteria bacterium REEB67]|nr:HigA family addiction module antidote protein [Cyanobacteria bacterium REEB67]
MNKKFEPIHPGEVLKEEFMRPLGLSANQLALRLHVPAGRITSIINGQRGITPETALRLSKFFTISAEFWLNLQQLYELRLAEQSSGEKIAEEVRPYK